MLTSICLYLRNAGSAKSVIRVGVDLAQRASARLRGLTLVDTRRAHEACHSESAVYADLAHQRQAKLEQRLTKIRRDLSRACLGADLEFDVRRAAGDPFQVLPRESQFHDLVVTSLGHDPKRPPSDAERRGRDLVRLIQAGMRPLLVAPPANRKISRVLLAYDGSEASGRAIRSFLDMDIFAEAECRLLAVGTDADAARHSLRSMADYCHSRRHGLETGWVRSSLRRVLHPFASRWQADLIVLGVDRARLLTPRLWFPCKWAQLSSDGRGVYLHG